MEAGGGLPRGWESGRVGWQACGMGFLGGGGGVDASVGAVGSSTLPPTMAPGRGAELWIRPMAPRCPAGGGNSKEVRAGPVSALLAPTSRPGLAGSGWGWRPRAGMWCGHEGQLRSHGKADTASGSGPWTQREFVASLRLHRGVVRWGGEASLRTGRWSKCWQMITSTWPCNNLSCVWTPSRHSPSSERLDGCAGVRRCGSQLEPI